MPDVLGLWVIPALLALVPAVFRLHRGRAMAAHRDDPALPERLIGTRNLLTAVFSVVLAVEIGVWTRHTWWSIPLLLLSLLAAGWPLRRVLFGETWSLAAYLWFYVRLVVGIYGFWLLLIAAPWLTGINGGAPWIVITGLGALLLIWNEQYGLLLRFLMRAQPIARPDLLDRFGAIVTNARIPEPRAEVVDMRGGVLVNAIALPDTERPGVLFTSSLLDRLDAREVAAIFAHEVAHLEHFNRAFLRKYRWMGWALVATAVSVAPLLQNYAPEWTWMTAGWPFVVFAYLAIQTQSRQKHETESDLRAVALSGDPEALISGLTRLHALARMPRRLDPNVEVNASHPSLARRIQAIRNAAMMPPADLSAPITFAHGSSSVTLHADRVEWNEGGQSSHTLSYGVLDELRIEADGHGLTRLAASDPQGRRWTLPLAAADVARAQAALDVVDARLRPAPSGHGLWRPIGTLVALLCAIAAGGATQVAAFVVALIAAFSFERPLVRAAGAAGVIGGSIALANGVATEFAAIAVLSALLLLFISHRDRRETFSRWTWRIVTVFGVLALLTTVPVLISGRDLLSMHQAARAWPAAAVLMAAFAAAISLRSDRWRWPAMAALVMGGALATIGATQTLDLILDDPFLADTKEPAATPLAGEASSEFTLDFSPFELLLSPGARALAALEEDENERHTIHVGRPGAALVPVAADTAVFVDDERLLLAVENRDATTVRLIDVDHPATPVWEHSLQAANASLALDRGASRWQALAHGLDKTLVAVTGSLDGGPANERRWQYPTVHEGANYWPLAAAGSRLLASSTSYQNTLGRFGSWGYLLGINSYQSTTQFLTIDTGTTSPLFASRLQLNCRPSALVEDGPVCSAYDGTRTHVARLNADGSLTPLATFSTISTFEVSPGWVTGWARTPFALNLATGQVFTFSSRRGPEGEFPFLMTAAQDTLAVVFSNASGLTTTVRLYRSPVGRSAMR
jgi:heat shock protein HtpX